MQSDSLTEGIGFLPVDRIAVVIVCENQDGECLQSVSRSLQHFPDGNIYVFDCSEASSSCYTLHDVLEENDLHMVHYLTGRDKDPRAALRQMCCTELKKYDYLFLVNPTIASRSTMKRFSSFSSLPSDTASETSCSSISSPFVDLAPNSSGTESTKSAASLKGVDGDLWTRHSLWKHLEGHTFHTHPIYNEPCCFLSLAE